MLKKFLKTLLVIILLWSIIFVINIIRIKNYNEPILYLKAIGHEFETTYTCLGYNIKTSKVRDFILHAEMYFGNFKIFETKTLKYEYNPSSDEITIIE